MRRARTRARDPPRLRSRTRCTCRGSACPSIPHPARRHTSVFPQEIETSLFTQKPLNWSFACKEGVDESFWEPSDTSGHQEIVGENPGNTRKRWGAPFGSLLPGLSGRNKRTRCPGLLHTPGSPSPGTAGEAGEREPRSVGQEARAGSPQRGMRAPRGVVGRGRMQKGQTDRPGDRGRGEARGVRCRWSGVQAGAGELKPRPTQPASCSCPWRVTGTRRAHSRADRPWPVHGHAELEGRAEAVGPETPNAPALRPFTGKVSPTALLTWEAV